MARGAGQVGMQGGGAGRGGEAKPCRRSPRRIHPCRRVLCLCLRHQHHTDDLCLSLSPNEPLASARCMKSRGANSSWI